MTDHRSVLNMDAESDNRMETTERKGNVLFNDALNTFYLRLYGVRHMVKDHSHSERGNPLPPHGLLFSIDRVLLYAPSHRQDNTYNGICYTSRGALAGTRNRVHTMEDRSDDPSLLPRSYISLLESTVTDEETTTNL